MTARQVFEGLLTELSKVNAPSMLLSEFNYYFNKAINQYINKRYNIYDINQQTTDDLRVLKSTAILDAKLVDNNKLLKNKIASLTTGKAKLFSATYEVNLPQDYLHILNCVCVYKVNKTWKCYNGGDYIQMSAKRLTADTWSVILNDYFNRPTPERPYFYIHNINVSDELPTNPLTKDNVNGTDISKPYQVEPELAEREYETTYWWSDGTEHQVIVQNENIYKMNTDGSIALDDYGHPIHAYKGTDKTDLVQFNELIIKRVPISSTVDNINDSNFPRTISLGDPMKGMTTDVVEREIGMRYGNPSGVRMEIRYGNDNSVFELQYVFIDYIKTPQHIRLTQEQVDLTEDTS